MTDSIRFWRSRMRCFAPEASGQSAKPTDPGTVSEQPSPEQEPELPMAQDPICRLLAEKLD